MVSGCGGGVVYNLLPDVWEGEIILLRLLHPSLCFQQVRASFMIHSGCFFTRFHVSIKGKDWHYRYCRSVLTLGAVREVRLYSAFFLKIRQAKKRFTLRSVIAPSAFNRMLSSLSHFQQCFWDLILYCRQTGSRGAPIRLFLVPISIPTPGLRVSVDTWSDTIAEFINFIPSTFCWRD